MTIGNALTFIKKAQKDTSLRKRLNASKNQQEIESVLADANLSFSAHDFDEAYHHSLTLCQEYEEAEALKEFKLWWDLLMQMTGAAQCGESCSGCG